METINTVNFEDLFDFSPEPVDQVASGGGGGANSGEGRASVSSTNNEQLQSRATDTGGYEDAAGDAFADFDRVLAGGTYVVPSGNPRSSDSASGLKLSTSVPSNWSGGISSTASSADTNRGFTVGSVGQLLNELPEAASASVPVVTKSKRGRKPGQKSLRTDMKTKLERSRQSARECRARKKLRYQYLDDLILEREKANELLRQELLKYQKWCHELDKGRIPDGLDNLLKEFKAEQQTQ